MIDNLLDKSGWLNAIEETEARVRRSLAIQCERGLGSVSILARSEGQPALHCSGEDDLRRTVQYIAIFEEDQCQVDSYKTILYLHTSLVCFRGCTDVEVSCDRRDGDLQHDLGKVLASAHARASPKRHHVLRHDREIF